MNTFGSDDLTRLLHWRADKCIALAGGVLSSGDYYIAGSSIASDTIRDIDVYPSANNEQFIIPKTNRVAKTKNAVTVRNPETDTLIQFCNYRKDSLLDLLESFDFAHIQAGATISDGTINQSRMDRSISL